MSGGQGGIRDRMQMKGQIDNIHRAGMGNAQHAVHSEQERFTEKTCV